MSVEEAAAKPPRYPRVFNARSRRVGISSRSVLVTRATPWGNPHVVRASEPDSRAAAVFAHRRDVARRIGDEPGYLDDLRRDLGGMDLGCACFPLPCHAPTLRAAANSRPGGPLE